LLDGYKSPVRVDTEIRELKEEIRDLEKDVGELDDRIARARRGRAEALTMLERVRKVCADEVQLDKAIALLQDLDLEN
jgi:predicted  nucleic acid-binding Zn-ribbon protein